jgi:chitodextrinase
MHAELLIRMMGRSSPSPKGYVRRKRVTAAAVAAGMIMGIPIGAVAGPGQAPPLNTTLPTIVGSAVTNGKLSGNPGKWIGKGIKYSMQWMRCSSSGGTCQTIAGATQSAYVVSAGDVGATIRLTVVATNHRGSATATSQATEVVVTSQTNTRLVDQDPPTTPSEFQPTSSTHVSISLAWSASSDNIGVAGYDVYIDGSRASSTSSTGYTASNLECGTTFTFAVEAFDAAGNRSGRASATASTSACPPPPDTQPPSDPTGFRILGVFASSVTLAWSPSTDNVGVAGYGLYRGGASLGSNTTTSYTVLGLACGTAYTFAVDAFDAAGNRSGKAALTASTAACSSSDPSAQAMPVGDLPGWRQIFADSFATDVPLGSFPAAASSRWSSYPYPWKDTSENGTYYPQKGVSIHGGLMDIWLHTETLNGVATHIVNAPNPILPGKTSGKGQLYGRYVVRFRADPVPGYKTAWLLWPDSGVWPRDGEIDFPEGNLPGQIHAFMHRQGAVSGSDQDAYSTGAYYTTWHTAVIEWLPNRCTFILDGRVIGNATSRIPNTPMHWVLQTETQLSGGAPASTASGHVYIDWVAVYAPA